VLGFKVLEPGGRTWALRPALGNLTSVQAGFETGLGWFEASVEVREGSIEVELDTPPGTDGLFTPPEKCSKMVIDNIIAQSVSVKGGKRRIVCNYL
jgi:hypothetical protein